MELRGKHLLSPISCARQRVSSPGQIHMASRFSSLSKLASAAGWSAGLVCPARRGRGCLSSALGRAQTPSKLPYLHAEMKGAAQPEPKGSCSAACS